MGSCFPIYQSASSSSSHNQVRRGSDHWHRHHWEIYRTTLTNPCNNLQKSMYQCWQTQFCSKLEKSMCSSSGHNQVRRGSDHWHRHRWSWTEVSFQSSLCSVSNNVSFCLFLRAGTFQHSVIFRHFSGPHNNNKGECRTKHNHQEQRSFTCSFTFFQSSFCSVSNKMLLCCFFFANWNFPTFFQCYFKTIL